MATWNAYIELKQGGIVWIDGQYGQASYFTTKGDAMKEVVADRSREYIVVQPGVDRL
jgi:hypothetical protein